jgi:hypothetical protein
MTQVLSADRPGQLPKLDLLSNPFVILQAPIDATREDVASAFDDRLADGVADESDLKDARRRLLAPKLRTQATVEFMPDATDSSRTRAIEALRDGKPLADLIALAKELPPFSRATFLSNVAQLRPSSGAVKYFAWSQAGVDRSALIDVVGEISHSAKVPQPPADSVTDAIEVVTSQNADRLFSSYVDIISAAADMRRCLEERLPTATEDEVNAYSTVIEAYDRKTSSGAHVRRQQVEDAAELIRRDPHSGSAQQSLFDALRAWDTLIQPQQMLAQHKGRDHTGARDLFVFLRGLMLELANEKNAASTAFSISKVCLEVFAELPRAVQQLRDDETSLQELVDQAGLKDLHEFVETVKHDLTTLARDLNRGGFSARAPGLAGRLYALFDRSLAATRATSASKYAWALVRSLALDINNDLGEGAASERLLEGLRSHATFGNAPAETRAAIEADYQTAKSNVLQSRVSQAIERKNWKEARSLLSELVAVTTDQAERSQYRQVIDGIDAQNRRQVGRYVIWGIILLAVVGYVASQNGGSRNSQYRSSTTSTAPVSSAATAEEIRPSVGMSGVFTRPNLRYCFYRRARLDAIDAPLAVETNNRVIDAFNREIEDYNSRCGNFRYYPDDKAAVEREVASKQATLAAEGRQLLQRWRAAN